MKASVLKENLAKALSVAGRVVSTRGSLEILSHIMVSTEKGRMRISATNLEIGINYWIGGKIEKEGDITIPARLFTDVVNSISSEKIDISIEEMDVKIKSENDNLSIKGVSAEEFPLIPSIKGEPLLVINSGILKDALNLVNFAAALDEARPVLSGIYFNLDGDNLILAATDSYRLAEKKIKLEVKSTNKKEIIIPAKTMIELSRILSDLDEDIKIYIDDNQVLFAAKDIEFTSRLIEGQFPNYQQIIPGENETKAIINSNEFSNAIKVATLFSRESANSINIFIKSKGEVEIKAISSQIGESDTVIKAEIIGKDGEISFNGKYLLDVLTNLKSPKVSFEMSGKLSPGTIKSEKNDDYVYIIMPLRS
ncbi:MAG: DNA polymerase III subunit beta [Patescibacteria group bacterium]|jgi:DNA polymerase-3 subunit beta|nr:DNA polymerase III subunit beta [Patescibacteria group bacterium]